MNWIIVLGVIIGGIGILLTFYGSLSSLINKITKWIIIVLGVVLITVGSILTFHGTALSSSEDKNEIIKKIDDFKLNLDKIKTENLSKDEKEKQINKIETEFQSWAEQFIQTKEEKRILLDKNELVLKEKKLRLNNNWRELYANFFMSLTQMVEAYNKVNDNDKIIFKESPKFPTNIYEAKRSTFHIILKFKENVYWIIWLKIREPVEANEIPSIEIEVSNKPEGLGLPWGDLSFRFSIENEKIYVDQMNIFEKANFKHEYILNMKERQLTDLLKQAFEYQILTLANN